MNDINKLIEELKSQRASKKEAEELALFSKNLSNLLKLERSEEFKNRFLNQIGSSKFSRGQMYKRIFLPAFLTVVLFIGFASVVSAQKSLPGDTLYPVKQFSEKAAIFVDPSFKNALLGIRSNEVKNLSNDTSTANFNKAVEEYERELNGNKKLTLEQIKESKKNLQEAQRASSKENIHELENVIIQTDQRQILIEEKDVKGSSTSTSFNKKREQGQSHRGKQDK
ncbi:MAG TPA: hypothetical protein VES68_00250 [Candidatus Sulfotelmatobacter sp.]|nr:hypothetical protein [Candidatus Sulfotelmatobacter sp.]